MSANYREIGANVRFSTKGRRYLLSRPELLARSYERSIFDRLDAKHPLKTTLAPMIEERIAEGVLWTEKDFRPIAEAMDCLFRDNG